MSFSDSEGSSQGGGTTDYKTFRNVSRERLLFEMVRSSKSGNSKSWKVLIMDKVTVRVMSCSCKMADITDEGVSLVEDLFRRRQPLPSMDAIYFIQPSKENVVMFLSDMSGREPLYRKAYVYFSSPIPKDLVSRIKNDTSVLPRIGALREMNLEYFSVDSHAYITDHERALEDLYSEGAEGSRKFDICLNLMASRMATVFASLKEFPVVRYRGAKSLDTSAATSFRDLVPTKLAASVWNIISTYKTSIPDFPKSETCELLILDRSVDQIAPVIHEWTYEAMCHDLLDLDGNKYVYEEFPVVRYRGAKSLDTSAATSFRDLVPTKLAASVWNIISTYKTSIPDFPKSETCELLILDRSVDQIAPVIHEWTYEAMCHDLLDLDGNKYVYEEFPVVRYRGAKSLDTSAATSFRDLVPTKLAASVWNIISTYKTSIPDFPKSETCELLILDRSVDQIAPVIHEWTYEAMCHDLLDLDGNKYVYEVPSKSGGQPEKKDVLLEDHDPVWLELRHTHIADASERLHEKMTTFMSKNKAASLQQKDISELSTRDLQKMVQALPQYNEQMEKLSIHVEIAGKINKIIRDTGMRELGQLEQDIVFGDAGTKEIINFLRTKQDTSSENKLRLLLIYASVYPEKFEGDKASKLMQLARLTHDDMKAVKNMRLLEGSEARKATGGGFSLKFDAHKRKHAARKDRAGDEETWQLFRFYPMLEEVIEKLSKGELPKEDYQTMNEPSSKAPEGSRRSQSVSAKPATNQPPAPHSMRSRRTATWAKPRHSDDGYSSDSVLRTSSSDFKYMGQRIFIFIIGGATRSELRVCHKLTPKLRREIVLGSSSFDDPPQYITKLKLLSETDLSVDDIRI